MRKALALAAFLAMAPYAQAQTEGGTGTFTPNAEYRLRYQYDQNVAADKDTEPTSQNAITQRFKLGGTFKATDKLSATFTLLHNATWGSNDLGVTGGTGDAKAQQNGIGDAENMVLVHEAYGSWMVSDEFTLRFGRGSFTFGDGTVIHGNDWEATPYAFEGALGTYEMEAGRLSAFFVRFAEYSSGTAPASGATDQDAEANSVGLTYSHKTLPEFMNRADIHVIKNTKAFTSGAGTAAAQLGQDMLRYGVSLGGDVDMIDWRAAYNAHTGDYLSTASAKLDGAGNMMEAEIGGNFEEFMKSRVYVLYHQDSGDSDASDDKVETYDSYFYDKHYNAGLMDVIGWGNLTQISVGYTLEPMDATTVGLHYHMFSKTEEAGAYVTGINGGAITANDTTKDELGQEIDLVGTHTYDNGLMVLGRLGMFMPGDALKPTHEDTYTTVFVEAKMNF